MAVATANRTVVGVFSSMDDAQRAFDALQNEGFSRDEISFIANKNAEHSWGADDARTDTGDTASNVAADAGIGAALGGVGGLLLSFAGLAVPGVGPVLAAGPIIAALGGAGIGAAAGGLIGALTESGIPEEHAQHYAEGVRRGDILVTVRTDDTRAERAAEIMDDNGAIDIDRRVSGWRERGWEKYDASAQPLAEDELRREREYYRAAREQGDEWGDQTRRAVNLGTRPGIGAKGPGAGHTEFTAGGPGVTTGTGPGRMVGTEAGMGTGPGHHMDDMVRNRVSAPSAGPGESNIPGSETRSAERDAARTSGTSGTGQRDRSGVEAIRDRTEGLMHEADDEIHHAGRDTKRGAARIYEKLRS